MIIIVTNAYFLLVTDTTAAEWTKSEGEKKEEAEKGVKTVSEMVEERQNEFEESLDRLEKELAPSTEISDGTFSRLEKKISFHQGTK